MILLAALALLLALVPAVMHWRNTREYRPAPPRSPGRVAVSYLIPARNEEAGIEAAVRAALASTDVDLEVIVLDDDSDDETRAIVESVADGDDRVRVESAPPLPDGWCGKQHACHVLSQLASHDLLAFVDADVRVSPDALSRSVRFLHESRADLVSGIPQQETGTLLEKLLIPMIHFLLLGFLPMRRMRESPMVALAAGCGQFFLCRREPYERAGGHAAIRDTLHDGIRLPRAFRQAGFRTDLFDATDIATCRMYRTASQVWCGLAKNAREGLGSPRLIGPATAWLLAGQVLPFALLPIALVLGDPVVAAIAFAAMAAAWYPRIDAAVRFRLSPLGAVLHPVGIVVMLAIQWYALLRRPTTWKGRTYRGRAIPAEAKQRTSPV